MYCFQLLTDEAVSQLGNHCPGLRQLCLSGCALLTDASLTVLAQRCPLLTTLEAAQCSLFSDNGFQALARVSIALIIQLLYVRLWILIVFRFQNCRLLERMDLEECVLITDVTLMNLAMGCPRLEKLVIVCLISS